VVAPIFQKMAPALAATEAAQTAEPEIVCPEADDPDCKEGNAGKSEQKIEETKT